ncbi:MAG: amidohydrolase family protein [Proteobacteria bacterium]|nr:amidohydrolase family protein [Pseudomonadota bacterium]
MDLLISDTVIVTCDDRRCILDRAGLLIRGGRIAEIGDSATLARAHPGVPRFDGRGKAVLPGFINSHTHTVLTVLRGTVEDMSGNVVYGYMSPISFVMEPAERAVMATLGCLEAIRSGTTTLVENFRFTQSFAPAMVRTGLRLFFSENCADALLLKIRHGEYSFDRDWGKQFLDRATALIESLHDTAGGRVQCQVAAHAPDNCSPWMLGELNALAARHKLTRTIHLAQSPEEMRQVKAAHGGTPAEYLQQHGWLAPDVVAAHWTFCTEADVDLLQAHGVHMAHCPANSSRRGPHRAPLARIRERGVNIALGTDNMTEDMFHAMKIALILYRGARGGSVDPAPQALLDGVTRNGAAALGRLHDLGTIAVGKQADLTIVDLNRASLRPIVSLVSNLVHYGHPGVVDSVMVAGEFVMRGGKVLTIDEEAVLQESQAVAERVWTRLLAQSPDIPPPANLQWLAA